MAKANGTHVDVTGKVVVITGAARGMGRAYSEAFLERGANVVALDRAWQAEDVQPLRQRLEASGNGLVLSADVTDDAQVDAAFQATLQRFGGRVDALVNNAAMRQRDFYPVAGASAVLDTLDGHWEQMFQVNVVGVLKMIRRFVQPMLQQRHGSIVNISSNGCVTVPSGEGVWEALHPSALNQPYDASKAALTSLSFYLAAEVRPHNVAVNVVFPAGTRTTGSDELADGRRALGISTRLLRPEHVVPLVLYLCAQDASGETGRAFDAARWNQQHGYGAPDAWLAPAPSTSLT